MVYFLKINYLVNDLSEAWPARATERGGEIQRCVLSKLKGVYLLCLVSPAQKLIFQSDFL